tara:strand:- start:2729 stop:3061 length:333 start_codon:yes stop_codon:yes gene_type:complete
MVARNPNNLISFGHSDGIAEDIVHFTIDGGATLANETNPGEAMEAIMETIGTKATVLAVGAEDGNGAFRVMVHGSAWSASDLQTALQALGATVGANSYDASGATATGFTY